MGSMLIYFLYYKTRMYMCICYVYKYDDLLWLLYTMICYEYCCDGDLGGLWRILFGSPRGTPLLLILVVGTLSGPFSIPYPWSGFENRRLGKTPLEPRPRWEVREGTDTWSEWYNLSGVIQHEWFGSTSGSYMEEIGGGLRNCFELFWFWKCLC